MLVVDDRIDDAAYGSRRRPQEYCQDSDREWRQRRRRECGEHARHVLKDVRSLLVAWHDGITPRRATWLRLHPRGFRPRAVEEVQ